MAVLLPQVHLDVERIPVVPELASSGANVHREKEHLIAAHIELELVRESFYVTLL
jgi:hypothetical protein